MAQLVFIMHGVNCPCVRYSVSLQSEQTANDHVQTHQLFVTVILELYVEVTEVLPGRVSLQRQRYVLVSLRGCTLRACIYAADTARYELRLPKGTRERRPCAILARCMQVLCASACRVRTDC